MTRQILFIVKNAVKEIKAPVRTDMSKLQVSRTDDTGASATGRTAPDAGRRSAQHRGQRAHVRRAAGVGRARNHRADAASEQWGAFRRTQRGRGLSAPGSMTRPSG